MNKNNLRKKFMNKREDLSDSRVIFKSKRIVNNFLETDFYSNSDKIFLYVSYKNEVQTRHLIKKMLEDNRDVYVPAPDPDTKEMDAVLIDKFSDLTEGAYGILEPINSNSKIDPSFLDLIIVPGLVFSLKGFRIGYGGGFYDRFLARSNNRERNPIKLSFVYSEYIIDEVPTNKYDLPVDFIITEGKIINCKEYRRN